MIELQENQVLQLCTLMYLKEFAKYAMTNSGQTLNDAIVYLRDNGNWTPLKASMDENSNCMEMDLETWKRLLNCIQSNNYMKNLKLTSRQV